MGKRTTVDLGPLPDLIGYVLRRAQLVVFQDFFAAFAQGAKCAIHVRQLAGGNTHHLLEAAFKAFGRALDAATRRDPRRTGVPSSKGRIG